MYFLQSPGIAYGQVYSTAVATTYYASIMALTIKYLISSFAEILPWTYCRPGWGSECVGASEYLPQTINETAVKRVSSAELFFTKSVLREADNLDNGLGMPSWDLVLCLMAAWILIAIVLIRGIRSSGKASYFLAIFPYVVMSVLLWRALTLPGALDGIVYFLKPQWDQLLNPQVGYDEKKSSRFCCIFMNFLYAFFQVWYNAITQMFFSLAICFGTLVMYASFNNFRKNVYR